MPSRTREAAVHVGTSGWTYDDWTGRFYPEDVRGPDRLSFYARHFDTVEVNATFYRTPFKGMIAGWNRRLPAGFHLVLKGPRLVTHLKRLRDCDDALAKFFDRVLPLRTLRVVLWQLPPTLAKDAALLDQFLARLPGAVRHAVEFRHASWWDDEVAETLGRRSAAFVTVSHPRLPDTVMATTDLLYVRFHGLGKRLYDYDYSRRELAAMARAVRERLPGRTLYAFFNNDVGGHAVDNARTFRDLVRGRKSG